MKEKVVEVYDKLAKDYEIHVDTQSGHNAYYERPAMMKLMPTNMNQLAVLDAGCAAGWYTEQFIKLGAQVTAVDLSPAMVEACKRRVGNEAEVFTCDLTDTRGLIVLQEVIKAVSGKGDPVKNFFYYDAQDGRHLQLFYLLTTES